MSVLILTNKLIKHDAVRSFFVLFAIEVLFRRMCPCGANGAQSILRVVDLQVDTPTEV